MKTGCEHTNLIYKCMPFNYSSYYFNDRHHCADFLSLEAQKKIKSISNEQFQRVELSLQFFGEKKNKAKQNKTNGKKKSAYLLWAILSVPNLNTKVRIKTIGIKIACSFCFKV